MKEKYIQEIVEYLKAQDERLVQGLAELSRIVDRKRLEYIVAFAKKYFEKL